MHLSETNIQELAYAYVKNVQLTEWQVGYKRHMADCDDCYNKFLSEKKLQEILFEAGLINDSIMQEVFAQENSYAGKILLSMKKTADGLKFLMEGLKEKADSMWNFSLVPELAFSRGEQEEKSEIYENVSSEYSMIQVKESGMLVRLDEDDYQGERLVLKMTKGEEVSWLPFCYNEEEESFEVIVSGRIEPGTEFQIMEVPDED